MTSLPESGYIKIEPDELENIVKHFKDLGCCDYCSLRFSGASEAKAFSTLEFTKNGIKEETPENGVVRKIAKSNPCMACLGISQPSFCDDATDQIIKKATEAGYESNTFNIAVTLPIAHQIRSQSFWYYIVQTFPDSFKSLFPFGCVTVGAKDVIKWIIAPKIQEKTQMRFEPKSDFIINISVDYKDNVKECLGLAKLFPETFKSHRKRGLNNMSRKAVEDKFTKCLCEEDFRQEYPVPPSIPDSFASLSAVSFSHNSLYVAGRYCKLSRALPQTPWIVGNERKMQSSVQEKITGPIEILFRTSVTKFGASGREDVDVRMLGRGRPFTVELINPKRTKISFQQLRALEQQINSAEDQQVSVRDLQIVPKASLIDLKSGEECKCKIYEALCIMTSGYKDKLTDLSSLMPLELDQRTPIRVLHRRPVASRKRVIYSLSVLPVTKQSSVKDTELVRVELRTQAGTYVKEFIHGDLGRTIPSLQSLTEAPFIDILTLDVKDIELDWPPPVLYADKEEA